MATSRNDLIQLVKVKLEEISSFEEPSSFIIAAGDNDYDKVKPITSYIDDSLDKAAVYCLTNLPLTLLSHDIVEKFNEPCEVNSKGVGILPSIYSFGRPVRIHSRFWKRDCTTFITTQDPLYLLQQNHYTRGGPAKPVAVLNPANCMYELYSFPPELYNTTLYGASDHIILYHIPLVTSTPEEKEIPAESVQSPIHNFIALACAAEVLDIMGNPQAAALMRQQYNTLLDSILH